MDLRSREVSELKTKVNHQEGNERGEIDTSAPFESVKEAVTRFGGIGYWKPHQSKLHKNKKETEEVNMAEMEKKAEELEKELESTKMILDELKSKLRKQAIEFDISQTSNDLAAIRASVEMLTKKLNKEKHSLEKISSLEKELDETNQQLQLVKDVKMEKELDETNQQLQLVKDVKMEKEKNPRAELGVEEAREGQFHKRKSDQGGKRLKKTAKFNNSYQIRERRVASVSSYNSSGEAPTPALSATLSIGEILSRKLVIPPQNFEKHNVSGHKRKKYGFPHFRLLLTKQSKKKNKPALDLR